MINLGTSKHAARVVHRCENCGGRIKIGERYVRSRIVDGGEAWVWKSHADCQAASEILWKAGIEGGEGMLVKIMDFEREDRELVRAKDLELANRLWPHIVGGTNAS